MANKRKTINFKYQTLKRNVFVILAFFLIFTFLTLASETNAADASLYLSPSTGVYAVGSTFSVAVEVNSGGETINAAEGTLTFDSDKLSVISISKNGSIFTLWATGPTFSNSAGTISFGGGTPENFNGSSGIIITISFRAKAVGSSNVNFSIGSVLAADYKGTNVLATMASGTYVIQPSKIPLPEYVPPERAPAAPTISSPTHSNSEEWYSDNDPKFIWEVPEDITSLKLLVDHQPITIPTIFYSEVISEKQLEDLEDGIWYFHVQLHNEFGWGGVSHFKLQIDTQYPIPFEIEVKEGKETTHPQPTLFFETIDEPSGIDYFEVQIDRQSPIKVEKAEYKLAPQPIGEHLILIKAVDKAGNKMLSSVVVSIIPPAFFRIGGIIIDYLAITITLLALIAITISGFIWIWRKIKQKRERLKKETTEAEKALYRAFRILSKEIAKQVAEWDKKPGLSAKERKMSDSLRKALRASKKLISKEIKDIEEELE